MGPVISSNGSDKDPKAERPLPLPAKRAIVALGQDISKARRRRGLTQQDVATRAGVSHSTIKRLEAGDHRSQLHLVARVLMIFGELQKLATLLDTVKDDVGLALADEALPARVRRRKTSPNAF
jgi:predicted transcriptional regulator